MPRRLHTVPDAPARLPPQRAFGKLAARARHETPVSPTALAALPRHRLVLALFLAFAAAPAPAAEPAAHAPACPVGVVLCPPRPTSFAMCRQNDLLDAWVPGLPVAGERSQEPRELEADRVHSPDEDTWVLEGDVELRQLDLRLHAGRIVWHRDSTDYEATGGVTFQDRSLLVAAERAEGNAERDQCTLDGVRYQLLGARGNGVAEVAIIDDPGHARLAGVRYSTCDVSDQQWAFAARELDLDRERGVGIGRDVSFRIRNVPVFWLPWLRFPIDDRRVSGFLYPGIGLGERRGLDLTIPYYLNLAPNYDATLYPRLMSKRGLMLGGEFRYLTTHSRGSFNAQLLPHDRRAGDDETRTGQPRPEQRWWYQWQDSTRLDDTWSFRADINRVSDKSYFEDFGRGLYSSAISFLPSRAYLSGRGAGWNASIGGDQYQITDPTLADRFEPYRRLPRATLNAAWDVAGPLQAGVDGEFVAFSRREAVEGQRLDLFPWVGAAFETSGWFLRPKLGYRWTGYELSHLEYARPEVTARSPSRGLPIASVDAGLVFERDFRLQGHDWIQTLEPRAYYLYVPYRDQQNLPLFDTQEIPFSFGMLFRSNRFAGADRQMDANDLSLALTTRLFEAASGEERLAASIGQIRHFDPQRVQLPGRPRTDWSGSVYAGELDLRLSPRWRLVLDQQWDPNARRTELSTFTVQSRFGRGGVANASYRYRRDFLEQVDLSAAIPLNEAWRLVLRENRALSDARLPGSGSRTLERFVGLEHESCCLAWRVIARRWLHNSQGELDTALYVELEFKGVGSVGQATGDFLRRGILGFQ